MGEVERPEETPGDPDGFEEVELGVPRAVFEAIEDLEPTERQRKSRHAEQRRLRSEVQRLEVNIGLVGARVLPEVEGARAKRAAERGDSVVGETVRAVCSSWTKPSTGKVVRPSPSRARVAPKT